MGFVVADTTAKITPLSRVFLEQEGADRWAREYRRKNPGRIVDVVPTGKSKLKTPAVAKNPS